MLATPMCAMAHTTALKMAHDVLVAFTRDVYVRNGAHLALRE